MWVLAFVSALTGQPYIIPVLHGYRYAAYTRVYINCNRAQGDYEFYQKHWQEHPKQREAFIRRITHAEYFGQAYVCEHMPAGSSWADKPAGDKRIKEYSIDTLGQRVRKEMDPPAPFYQPGEAYVGDDGKMHTAPKSPAHAPPVDEFGFAPRPLNPLGARLAAGALAEIAAREEKVRGRFVKPRPVRPASAPAPVPAAAEGMGLITPPARKQLNVIPPLKKHSRQQNLQSAPVKKKTQGVKVCLAEQRF